MTIPEWAERALEQFRPESLHRSDEPDPDRSRQWAGLDARFRERWMHLESEKWDVPVQHPKYVRLMGGYKFPPDEYVRQCILECAIESAWELGVGKDPKKTIEAVVLLDRLNGQISTMAGELAQLFRQRYELKESYSLSDQRASSDYHWPDAMRLFGAFELARERIKFGDLGESGNKTFDDFLNVASTQYRRMPNWADLLDEVAARSPRTMLSTDSGDIAVLGSTSNSTPWSRWALRLIGRLNSWGNFGVGKGFLLSCLSDQQLATLAEVAINAPSDVYSAPQMKELKKRYLKRESSKND